MATYSVYYHPSGAFAVKVDIPDDEVPVDEEDLVERLMDEAYDIVPYGVCAQCSGYGHANWSLDFSEAEVLAVENDEGKVLWEDK